MKPQTTPSPWLSIIGITEAGERDLNAHAKQHITQASHIFGGKRHLELLQNILVPSQQHIIPWPHPFKEGIKQIHSLRGEKVAILASGNPFFYGVGGTITKNIPAHETICFPAPSCVSYGCARLGWKEEQTKVISLCGHNIESIYPYLQPNAQFLFLSANAETPYALRDYLHSKGFQHFSLHILENLGGKHERIRTIPSEHPLPQDISPLNLIALTVSPEDRKYCLPLSDGWPDNRFANDGQITRQEIRALTLCALSPRNGQYLWDIGAGTGSIALEWILKTPYMRATAIEKNPQRATRIKRNAQQLGALSLDVIEDEAPHAFTQLSSPDAIFIGGGATHAHLLKKAWERLKQGGRIVCNGVTLETQSLLIKAQNSYGGMLRRFSIERIEPLGRFHRMQPDLAIVQWVAVKK